MAKIYREKEIEKLVEGLNNLGNNMSVLLELIKYGKIAVKPLVSFLLSPPSLFSEPRCLAAEALGMIGGEETVQGLIEVLDLCDLDLLDPQVRFAEETVRNQAARQLGILGDERAIEPLLKCLKENHLRDAAEALATFREKRAIPYIIELLEDDYAGETASKALLQFDKDVVILLIETLVRKKCTSFKDEKNLSVKRRAEAARLLGEIGDPRAIRPLLKRLEDEEWEVRLSSALALLEIGANKDEIVKVIPELIAGLNESDWYTLILCIDALLELNSAALPYIENALSEKAIENGKGERILLSEKAIEYLEGILQKSKDKE
ncbi:MAG: HEAT repeat domain-containing protein [Deltaproteobacteria bacterium]|nr:HEAT repeat domain-containing protein [Deltaproteobacteria bacterium]